MEEVSAYEAEESLKSCHFNTGAGKVKTPIRPCRPTTAKGGSVGELCLICQQDYQKNWEKSKI